MVLNQWRKRGKITLIYCSVDNSVHCCDIVENKRDEKKIFKERMTKK